MTPVLILHAGRLSLGELCVGDARVVFTSDAQAQRWLRPHLLDASAQRVLRRVLVGLGGADVSRVSREDAVLRIAHALTIGRVHAFARAVTTATLPRGGDEAPATRPMPTKTRTWVSIHLVDDGDPPRPVPSEAYAVTLPDGTVYEGVLDAHGRARIDDIDPGTCKVSFPNLHAPDWRAR